MRAHIGRIIKEGTKLYEFRLLIFKIYQKGLKIFLYNVMYDIYNIYFFTVKCIAHLAFMHTHKTHNYKHTHTSHYFRRFLFAIVFCNDS